MIQGLTYDSIRKSPVVFSALLIPLFLPFSVKLTWISIWLLLVTWLIFLFVRYREYDFTRWRQILLLCAPVLLILLSLLYSSDRSEGWKLGERSIPMIMFPLILLSAQKTERYHINLFLGVFTISVLAGGFYCLGHAIINLFTAEPLPVYTNGNYASTLTSKWNFFTYDSLLQPIGLHPTYFSIYTTVCLMFMWFRLGEVKRPASKFLVIVVIGFLLLFTILAAARMALLSFFVTAFCIIFFVNKQPVFHKVLVCVLLGGVLTVLFFTSPFFHERFAGMATWSYPDDVNGWNSLNLRYALWECSTTIFGQHWLTGVGAGDHTALSNACHTKFSFFNVYPGDLNSHNQYLEYGVIGGIFLLGSFLAVIGYCIYIAVHCNNYLYLAFLVLFCLNCLTESVLAVFKGIIFFSFVNSIFLAVLTHRNEKRDTKSR